MNAPDGEKQFMTPAQQRAYLNDLRRANEEMYNLTGARTNHGRDPWKSSVGDSQSTATIHLPSVVPLSPKGPPKPPKSDTLRALPTPPQSTTIAVPDQKTDAASTKPKPLPKPLRPQSQDVPSVAPLSLQEPPTARRLPPIPQKPTYISSPSRSSSAAFEPRKVSLTLTNYDIPQINVQSSEPDHLDHSKRVTIPVLSFPEDEEPQRRPPTFSLIVPGQEHDAKEDFLRPMRPEGRGKRPPIPTYKANMVKKGLHCANCYEQLGAGRAITANGKRYHPQHFTCYECDIPLEHVEFYAHTPPSLPSLDDADAEEVYCHFDYHELFTPRCHVCATPVIRNGVQALNRIYHSEHFFCALCSKTFDASVDFIQHDDLAWHPDCFAEKFNEKYHCRKCGGRILDDKIIKMGINSFFHDACFVCAGRTKESAKGGTGGGATASGRGGECRRSLKDGFYWSNANEGICRSCKEIELKTTYIPASTKR